MLLFLRYMLIFHSNIETARHADIRSRRSYYVYYGCCLTAGGAD